MALPKTPAKRAKASRPVAAKDGAPSTVKAAKVKITVKGAAASELQIKTINGCLQEAQRLGASRRVMIGVVMAITVESGAGIALQTTGNDDTGIFQQGTNWLPNASTKDPTLTTRAFLLSPKAGFPGGSAPGWKATHGSLKNAPSPLTEAVADIQEPRADLRGEYGRWEAEATKTVDAFLGGSTGSGATGEVSVTTVEPYLFTRGSKDSTEREDSWTAIGRLAEEVNFRRWAALNTLFFVSEEELRSAAPSVQMRGDESWLVRKPALDRGIGRPVAQVEFDVITSRWAVLPGAVVYIHPELDPRLEGRWLVSTVSDDLLSPLSTVTLKRPTPIQPEPAPETSTENVSIGGTTRSVDGAQIEGMITEADVRGLTPKQIIDRLALPIGAKNGAPRTVATNDAQNAVHGPTSSGKPSDHQGPPESAWAADMGIGPDIRYGNAAGAKKGDGMAKAYATLFGIPFNTGGLVNATHFGFRFQLIWRYDDHWDHVHIGCRKV